MFDVNSDIPGWVVFLLVTIQENVVNSVIAACTDFSVSDGLKESLHAFKRNFEYWEGLIRKAVT